MKLDKSHHNQRFKRTHPAGACQFIGFLANIPLFSRLTFMRAPLKRGAVMQLTYLQN